MNPVVSLGTKIQHRCPRCTYTGFSSRRVIQHLKRKHGVPAWMVRQVQMEVAA